MEKDRRIAQLEEENRAMKAQMKQMLENTVRTIFNNTSDGVVLIDTSGTVREWSKGYELMTGLDRHTVVDRMHIWELAARLGSTHEENTKNIEDQLKELTLNMQQKMFTRHIKHAKTGAHKTVNILYFPIEIPGGTMLGGISRDTTFDEQARIMMEEHERQLTVEKDRLQRLGDNLPNGCLYQFVYNTATGHAGFTYLSRAWERISGFTVEEAMSDINRLNERIHPDDLIIYTAAFEKSLNELTPFSTEIRFILKNGEMRWGLLSSLPRRDIDCVVWDGFLVDITDSKNTEQKLTAEKERINAISNNIPGTLYRFRAKLDGSSMAFEYLSGTWENIMGVSAEESIADIKNVFANVHPDDFPRLTECIRENIAILNPFHIEVRYIHPLNRTTSWFRLSSQPRREDDTMYADGIILDITAQKEAELKLIAEKERLEAIGDNYPDGCLFRATMDMHTQELNLTYVSKPWENLTGIPAEQAVKDVKLALSKIHPDDLPIYMADTIKSAQTGENMNTDIRFVLSDGSMKWAQIASHPHTEGHLIVWDGFFLDITARKETELMLLAEKERLEAIGDNIPGGALYRFKIDPVTHDIALDYVSDTWQTVIGISPDIILGLSSTEIHSKGLSIFDGIEPDDMPMLMERINYSLANMANFNIELRFRRHDHKLLWLLMSAKPSLQNGTIYVDGVIFDITARKEAEQKLLFEKNRLQALGDNLPNGVLFRFQIHETQLHDPNADWLQQLKLSYASALWDTFTNIPLANAMDDVRLPFMKIHPDDLAAIYPRIYQSMTDRTSFYAEVRYTYADDDMRWFQISANPHTENNMVVTDGFILDVTARKQAEQKLLAEKERLRSIGDNMPDGALYRSRINTQTGHMWLEYASATWERLSGVPIEAALADLNVLFAHMEPGDFDEMMKLSYKSIDDMQPFNFEFGYHHPIDQKTHRIRIASVPVADGESYYADGTLFDVTENREAEKALIAEKERLETIGDNVPDGALFRFRIDMLSDHMSLDYVSRSCQRITGIPAPLVLADINTIFANVHPDDLPTLIQCIRTSVYNIERFNIEIRYLHPDDKKEHWFRLTAQPRREGDIVYSDGIILDISERRKTESELATYRNELENKIRERTAELEIANTQLANRNNQLSNEINARMAVMEELEESESKVHNFIRQSFEGIMMLDSDGRILEWNKALERTTGVTHQQAAGMHEWDLLRQFLPENEQTPEQFDILRRKKTEYILGGPAQEPMFENQIIILSDGTKRYLQTSTFPIGLSNACYFGKIVHDITEQKQADMELEHYRTQLEEMVENKSRDLLTTHASLELTNRRQALFIKVLQILQMEPDVPVAMNMALAELGSYTGVDRLATWENHPDGINYGCTYEWCNEGVEPAIQYLGSIPVEEGKPWFDMLKKDDYICTSDMSTLHPYIQGMLEKQGVKAIAVFPMSILGKQFGFLSFNFCRVKEWNINDVELMNQMAQIMSTATRRWQIETALHASQQTMQKVLDNVNANIFVTDYETQKIIFANKKFREEAHCEVHGIECWKMLNAGKDCLCDHCPKDQLFDENNTPTGIIHWEDLNPITHRWYTIQSTVIKWTDGRWAIMELALDITDRKAEEQELIRAKEQAEESDMLKTAFLANVSHEIRTPLNGIIGFLHFLDDDNISPRERREYIDVVNNSSEQLVKLIDDIVDLARIEAGQMTINPAMCNINEMMYDVQAFFSGHMRSNGKEHIELIMDTSCFINPCIVCIDPVRLRQVLNNLISNAIKFTQQGSIRFGYRLNGNGMLEFTVADTGIGLNPDERSIIFERFRQAERSVNSRQYGGTGLGLTISRSLAQMMGGNITVESVKAHGSIFTATVSYLPITPDNQYLFERKQDEILFDSQPFAGTTALMIEPLAMKHKYYEKLLAPAGFAVKRLENTQQWLDYTGQQNRISTVILDTLALENVSDDDFRKLRATYKEQPMIIFGQEEKIRHLMSFCINPKNATFAEPVSCHNLVEALKKLDK